VVQVMSPEEQKLVKIVASIVDDWFGSIESDYIVCDKNTTLLVGMNVVAKVKENGIKLSGLSD
jgi:hypothetical protein